MIDKLSIRDLDLKGKKVLVRVDFNVPIEKGKITDDTRIRASLPTLQYVLEQGGSLILMSHMGRPRSPDPQLSLAPCARRLEELLQRPVQMAPDCRGPEVEKMVQQLEPGGVLLLENLRFHQGEEKPEEDPTFVCDLAKLGDLYINEAFGSAHRVHASTALITQFFPGRAAAGLHLEQEIAYLGSALLYPKRPFYAILGGAKISSKFKVIQTLIKQADALFIGGAMAFTFFKAQNISIGQSLVEDDFLGAARQLMEMSQTSRCRLLLPTDLVVARQINPQAEMCVIQVEEGVPEGFQGVDIGPQTIRYYAQELKKAETIFWNGPLGVFECPPFDKGTTAMAKSLADLSAITIIGGGDSVAAVEQAGVAKKMRHISTGGGASLEYIEFGHLPGIDVLSDKQTIIR
jgi:3-phosphoglycerate kinase